MKPRDYQSACHDAILKAWGLAPWAEMNLWRTHFALAADLGHAPWHDITAAHRAILAVLGTAAGKTIIAAHLIETLAAMGKRVLFCADTDELCQQPLDKIASATGIRPQLEKAESKAYALTCVPALLMPSSSVCVASVQTLSTSERLEDFVARWGEPDVIIHDEAHSGPERAAAINARFPSALVLGLTATPYRARSRTLSRWYEIVAFRMDAIDLIQQGWVTPLTVQGLQLDIDFDELLSRTPADAGGADLDPAAVARRITPVYREVARVLRDEIKRHTLVFHPLVRSSRLFVDVCREEGLSAAHCDGDSRDRAGIIAAFERGEIQVLSNSSVFSKGVDFIRADCLLNLDLTRSPGKYRQRVGRIMRALPGVLENLSSAAERRAAIAASVKPDALILDVLGQSEKLGLAGAATLVAHDPFERAAINRRITREPQRLDDLERAARAEATVRKREESLLRALRRHAQSETATTGATRFAPGSKEAKLDALFAAFAHAA
jgi:superfamily II DNA or RNA helicase